MTGEGGKTKLQRFRQVDGAPAGRLEDLLLTTEAVRHDQRIGGGLPDRRQ
jgi:hypothetical protein